MTPSITDYLIPSTIEEAIAALSSDDRSQIVAGGTDLIIAINQRKEQPGFLVDVSRIPQLRTIHCSKEQIKIGCAVPFSEIAEHPVIRQQLTALAEACSQIGSPQIRNKGTIGGNLGTGSAAADSICPLTAFTPRILMQDGNGSRESDLDHFWSKDCFSKVGRSVLLTQVVFTLPATPWKSAFVKLGRRQALAISRLNLTVAVTETKNGVIDQARVAIGSAGPHPYRVQTCEELCIGRTIAQIDQSSFQTAAEKALRQVLGNRSTVAYKARAIHALAADALQLLER